MEMVIWHLAHWSVWGKQRYFDNIFPKLYETLLPSSTARAQSMGWEGARWPKMTDLETGVNPIYRHFQPRHSQNFTLSPSLATQRREHAEH